MVPTSVKPAGLKKGGIEIVPTNTFTLETVPVDPYSSYTPPKIIQYITFKYDLSAFQTAASVPGLKKSTAWIFYSPLFLPDRSPAGLQSHMLSWLLFLMQVP